MPYPPGCSCASPAFHVGVNVIIGGVTQASGLPPGLSFPSIYGDTFIGGVPTAAGTYTGTVNGLPFAWVVAEVGSVTPSWTPDENTNLNFRTGEFNSYTFTATPNGGFSLYAGSVFAATCGALGDPLPAGLTFSGGMLSGTPQAGTEGTYHVEILVTSSPYNVSTGWMTIIIGTGGGGGTGDQTFSISDELVISDSIATSSYVITRNPSDSFGIYWADRVAIRITIIKNPPPPPPPPQFPDTCVFEFYNLETPLDVEELPVPKKYDQLGPMRFDKIGKIFGFRIRLLMNGTTTSVPYSIWGDQSLTSPRYGNLLFQGTFTVVPGKDKTYEIQLPKNINSDVVRITFGPTPDSFHRFNLLVKVHISGMKGQAQWLPIR